MLSGILENLADAVDDPILVTEVPGGDVDRARLVFANDAAERAFGYSQAELAGKAVGAMLSPENPTDLNAKIVSRLLKGDAVREQLIYRRKNGEDFWVDLSAKSLTADDGCCDFWIASLRDISAFKSIEKKLDSASARVDDLTQKLVATEEDATMRVDRLRAAIQTLPDPFVIYDKDDRLVLCNEAYKAIYHEVADLMVPGQVFETILRKGLEVGQYRAAIGREEEWLAERLATHRNPGPPTEQALGSGRYVRVFERVTEFGDIVGCRVDITEMKQKEAELADIAERLKDANSAMTHQAMHDALTGLPNRRYLDQHLAELKGDGGDGVSVGALHVDLDNFKQINDTLGHAAGDAALRFASRALNDVSREGDMVFRTGGDEFVMVVAGRIDRDLLFRIGTRIVEAMAVPFKVGQQACRIGASVGVSMQDAGALDPAELLSTSDIALYEAKRRGRNQVRVFSVDLKRKMRRTKRLADDLLTALDAGQFFPVYQPQVDARTGRLVGVETLCRWNHPGRGIVAPPEFMPIAHDLNVMPEIDRQIYNTAAADLEHLGALGHRVPRISFNLELERLMDNALLPSLRRISARGTQVAVELLESLSLDDKDTPVLWAVDALRDGGIEVEIDDFGSCRASLLGVLNVRPDAIKIDRTLVNSVINIRAQRDIIRALVNLANTLNIKVTAEGVESETHAEMLATLGCHTLQGYAIARPMEAKDLEMYLRTTPNARDLREQPDRRFDPAPGPADPARQAAAGAMTFSTRRLDERDAADPPAAAGGLG